MQRHHARPRSSDTVAVGVIRAVLVLALALTLAALTGGDPAGAVVGPRRIMGGPEDQLLPSANDTYLIWTANSEAFPNRYHAYGKVRRTSGRFRLNPSGTRGYSGGMDPGQNRAVYQQIDGRSSDLYTINLETRVRLRLPALVNSAQWERSPRVSDAFYLFARDTAATTTLLLYDRAAKSIESLATYEINRYSVTPGAVGEQYATWSVCTVFNCNAFIRNTATDQTRKIPAPDGRARYAPVVHEGEAQVYFARSGHACGVGVRILRVPLSDLGATPVSLAALPAGIDVGLQQSAQDLGTQVDLWFSRYRCGPMQGDIYRLRDVGQV
jgi:hypothetical protein